jgi:ribosomal protein L4
MTKPQLLSAFLSTVLAVGGGIALAQPKQNISKGLHPNLAKAQRLSDQAYQAVTMAQEANEFDLAGHAAKAKSLLEEVNRELKEAAEQSNRNKKGK